MIQKYFFSNNKRGVFTAETKPKIYKNKIPEEVE